MSLESGKRVEKRCNEQNDGSRDQARGSYDDTEPLNYAHDGVDGCAHVVGRESADEGIELGRGWADSEKERDLNEEDYEGADPGAVVRESRQSGQSRELVSYRHITLKMMTKLKLKMLAIPNAKHRIKASIPVL